MLTQCLPGGLEVGTSFVLAYGTNNQEEAERHRVWLYSAGAASGESVTMIEAIDSLRVAFKHSEVSGSRSVELFLRRLRTYAPRPTPQEHPDHTGSLSALRLQPSLDAILEGLITASDEDYKPVTEVLGQPMSRIGLIGFAAHIMTSTAVQEKDDPRIAFIAELRRPYVRVTAAS